jgi:hypothetical protein
MVQEQSGKGVLCRSQLDKEAGPQSVNKHLNGAAGRQCGLHLTCRVRKTKAKKREAGSVLEWRMVDPIFREQGDKQNIEETGKGGGGVEEQWT